MAKPVLNATLNKATLLQITLSKRQLFGEPNNHCSIFDVGKPYARMVQFQKRYFIETLEINETTSGHQHNALMYTSHFQKHLYDGYALSRFEFLSKPLHKCNEDRPYYASQNQDIFVKYH